MGSEKFELDEAALIENLILHIRSLVKQKEFLPFPIPIHTFYPLQRVSSQAKERFDQKILLLRETSTIAWIQLADNDDGCIKIAGTF